MPLTLHVIPETLNSYRLTLDYLRHLLADVEGDLLTRQPPGVVNHPAWTIGHLIYSAQAIGGELGLDPWLPADWQVRFGTGSTPQPTGYETKDYLLAALTDAQTRLTNRLHELGEAAMSQPLPDIRYRSTLPTLGHAVLHILTAHTSTHLGQLIIWRRAAGLPLLIKSFD